MARSTKELQEMRASHPDVWIPVEVQDSLEGEVVDIDTAWSDARGDYYPLLTILTTDGVEMKWHAFETVADSQVMKLQPLPGEHIVITYTGESPNSKPGRNPAKLFKVRMPGRSTEQLAGNVYGQLRSRAGGGRPQPPAQQAPNGAPDPDDVPFD